MQDTERGLSAQEVLKSREKYGENRLKEYKKSSFIKCFVSNLSDPIIKVLIGALFINIIFMIPNINWFECGGIMSSIIIATLVSTVSEYSSENTLEKLKANTQKSTAIVKRDGGVCEIGEEEVVCGDVYIATPGYGVVADGIVISGKITIDESALTGEGREVTKSSGDKVLKGSLVLGGEGVIRVEAVGEATYYGRVVKELSEKTRPSPLKKRLEQLAKSISVLGYIAAFLIAVAYLFNVFVIDAGFQWDKTLEMITDVRFLISKLISAVTLAVSIVVVAVPEGLPMMITVVLSSNMKKMMRDNVLVKKMVGIETSGNVNLLFTDKTGTLTEGKLKVKGVYSASGGSYTTESSLRKRPNFEKYVTLCANLCNFAVLNGKKAIGSDATDRAIKEHFAKNINNASVIEKIPFDSSKKYSSVRVELDGKEISLFKGAPEKIIIAAQKYLDENGEERELNKEERGALCEKLRELTSHSYRVVALGYKRENSHLENIVFISLIAIRDKIRREVPLAIKQVQGAGVGVVMITGDNSDTAKAIALECGIISPTSKRKDVITGAMLEQMSDDEIGRLLPTVAVIARALPSDKSRLVRIAQRNGYVVGMTGDGINDAPSLKAADVGFGMGSGTEVAKEACDIVITDNNFVSIVKAILYGRTVFQSIRKFIVFQLIMNLGAVGISLLGPFIGVDNPVTITQMLWVNIIMDTLGALAFAKEPNLQEYMLEKPKPYDEKIISRRMLEQIISTGIYVLLLCVWFLKSDALTYILERSEEEYILSAFFAMFIFAGIFTCFTARTERLNILANISRNRSFIIIMIGITVMQMAFIYLGGDTFRCVPLYVADLFRIGLISFTVVIFDFARKLLKKLVRRKKKCQRTNIFMREH